MNTTNKAGISSVKTTDVDVKYILTYVVFIEDIPALLC
jgi:hypothetical protein